VLDIFSSNIVTGNLVISNTSADIYLEGSSGNYVATNRIQTGNNAGVFMHAAANNQFVANVSCGNTNVDFCAYNSTGNGVGNISWEMGEDLRPCLIVQYHRPGAGKVRVRVENEWDMLLNGADAYQNGHSIGRTSAGGNLTFQDVQSG